MPIKFNPGKSRSNCQKPQNFIKRNWPKHMEKVEAKKGIQPEEVTTISENFAPSFLEKSPQKDCFDFSTEELGYIVGPHGERIKTVFPR